MKIIKPFFFGITAALGALFLELLIGMFIGSPEDFADIFFSRITSILILSVLVEELLKLIFIYRSQLELKIYFQNNADEKEIGKSFFLNSFFVGAGFACMESFFIIFSLPSARDVFDLKLAISGILIIHAVTSSVMGYLLIKYSSSKFFAASIALLAAVLIHIIYNSLIIYSVQPLLIFAYLLFFVFVFSAMAFSVNVKGSKTGAF